MLVFGNLEIHKGARTVYLDENVLTLTPIEYDLLTRLAGAAGRVLTRDQLLDAVAGRTYDVFDRSVDVHISSLRRKLGEDPRNPGFIQNGQKCRIHVQNSRGAAIMKPAASLFTKILSWFFLNLILVAGTLVLFFTFQSHVNLHALFGQQGKDRLQTAGLLIAHDLGQTSRTRWSDVLARHAEIHQVDFTIVFEDGFQYSSKNEELPETVMTKIRNTLQHKPPEGSLPPSHEPPPPRRSSENQIVGNSKGNQALEREPPPPPKWNEEKPYWLMRTRHPARYWSALRMPLPSQPSQPPVPAILLAASDSITGHGFFFDPLPWILVAILVIFISVLFWIPMVRNITRPLARITRATEEMAEGNFHVSIHEARTDEIGRLSKAINHMSTRLSAFVKGQKRFLGDVAHELGSPIARIQFGLGALEQRMGKENQKRVWDVMEDVDHLSKLVNELLAFSRADIKADTVTLESIRLLPIVQEAVKREITSSEKIVIEIDSGIHVIASPELLTRALANLIRNAVKYAGETGPVYITAEKRAAGVQITVRDSGSGVPEDLLHQLFEPFFRPEPSRDRDSGGVGLGLAIVKTCVETCKGTVSAANLQPNGFAVTITLNT